MNRISRTQEIMLKQTNAMLRSTYPDHMKEFIMKLAKSISVRILPGAIDKPALEDVIQALHHVDSILSVNEDEAIEPGDLRGVSLMLENGEKVLAEMRAGLPAARQTSRRATSGSQAWPNIGQAFTPSH